MDWKKEIIKEKEVSEEKIGYKFNILAIIAIIIFTFSLCPITLQNDTFYTIKIGELIVNNGIDMKDNFSWHEDLPYTYPHWAYDVAIYEIYNTGNVIGDWAKSIDTGNENINTSIDEIDFGMTAIYISTIVLACVLGILIYLIATKLSKNKLIAFILTMGAMYLLKDFIAARAQLVSFILFALTILFIENFLEKKKKRYLVGLVLISIILANIHVAVWPFFFVLFLPYVAEYLIACIIDLHIPTRIKIFIKKLDNKEEILENVREATKKGREKPYKIKIRKNSAVKWLVLVMLICVFTGLLTPIGDTPYTYLYKTMQGNTMDSINEHKPLTLFDDKPTMIVITLFLVLLIFTDTKIKLSDLFMLAGIVFMCFMSRRQTSLLFIIGTFIMAKLLAGFLSKYDKEITRKIIKIITSISGKIVILSIVLIMAMTTYKSKAGSKFISSSSYPVDAATYILENLDIENMRLYNEYNYGSYLLFRGIPVFIDSRADLYSPEFNGTKNEDGKYEGRDIFSDYINISTISTYYENKFESYGITHVICVRNAKLNMFLSRDENYKELYKDDKFIIYERTIQ